MAKKFYSDKGVLNFSPVRGRHYLIAKGNTVTREIFLSDTSPDPLLPVSPLIPGFEHVMQFDIEFKQLMTEQRAIAKGLKPIMTYEKNMKVEGEANDRVETQKMCMVVRNEKTHFLLDREVHPFTIDFLSQDSGALKFLFNFSIKVLDANKILTDYPAGNFLVYAERRIISELSGIFRGKDFKKLRQIRDDQIVDGKKTVIKKLCGEFKKHGFVLENLMLEEIIVMPFSQDRVNAEEDVEVSKLESIATANRADGEAKAIAKKGSAEAFTLGKKLFKIFKFKQSTGKVINETAKITTENLGKLKGTLVVGKALTGNETDDQFTDMLIANYIQSNNQNQGRRNTNA